MKISEQQQYLDAAGRRVLITSRQKVRDLWVYHGFQIDRAGKMIGERRLWKSDGRCWAGSMSHNLVRPASLDMKLSEAASVVLERLIEACETDMALPGAVGPRKYGNGMPATPVTEFDIWVRDCQDMVDGEEDMIRKRNVAASDGDVRRAKCSPARISRMEEAFGWLGRFVMDHERRRLLIGYATCKASGADWGDYVAARNRNFPKEKHWVKRTIYRWIAIMLQDIATILRNRAIILRDGAGLLVAHEAA